VLGAPDNDASCFPEAAREEIEFSGLSPVSVLSSECSIGLKDGSGRRLHLTRAIKGDATTVRVRSITADGALREFRLNARQQTMQDETGGLQRFLFEWLGWPREKVATFRGVPSEVYLENLAPAFYINQDEGWTNIQALQITRYGQVQIAEISVEYLLGALEAVRVRVARQEAAQKVVALRDDARKISERVTMLFLRRGWRLEWSGNGSVAEILTRWTSRTLRQALKQDADVSLENEELSLVSRVDQLREKLTSAPIDPMDVSAPAAASQRVIDLKERRHSLNEELHTFRTQRGSTAELVDTLDHRITAASDLLRLKRTGVGRLEHLECPTCHRDLDPVTFALTDQSIDSVSNHIEALKRDRDLMKKNLQSIDAGAEIKLGVLIETEDQLRDAERALLTVTSAIGTVREQFAQIASDLNRAERQLERVREASRETDEMQKVVSNWIAEATAASRVERENPDLRSRRDAFLDSLRRYLRALGHSAVRPDNESQLEFDEQYVPTLNKR
jgi:hypothetical protein